VTASLKILGEIYEGKSQNVVGTLKGSKFQDEEILIMSHRDAAYWAPGANDNVSGDAPE